MCIFVYTDAGSHTHPPTVNANPPSLASGTQENRSAQPTTRGLSSSRARQGKAQVFVYLNKESSPLMRNNISDNEQLYKYTGRYLSKNSIPRPNKCYLCGVSSSNKVVHFDNIHVPCTSAPSSTTTVALTVCLICFKALNIMAILGHRDLLETQLRIRVGGKNRHPLLFEPITSPEGSIRHNTRCYINENEFSRRKNNTTRIVYNLNEPGCSAKIGTL